MCTCVVGIQSHRIPGTESFDVPTFDPPVMIYLSSKSEGLTDLGWYTTHHHGCNKDLF